MPPARGHIELPESQGDFEAKVVSDIREHGWHCVLVRDDAHPEHAALNAAMPPDPVADATFAYTAGVWLTLGHPDIILVGRWAHAHALLANAVALVQEGEELKPGSTSDRIVASFTVRFDEVDEAPRRALLTYTDWVNGRAPAPALQLVVPDAAGRWPEEEGYDSHAQPLLHR